MMRRFCFAFLGALILATGYASGSIFVKGQATAISGDLLTIRDTPFYLRDIDSFELGQNCWQAKKAVVDCGVEAKKSLQQLIAGRMLTCMAPGGTPYGAVVARCITDEGVDVGDEMVRRGWALARPDLTASDAKRLCGIEAEAKRLKVGAWKYAFALPYLYRGEGGKLTRDVSCGNHPRFP